MADLNFPTSPSVNDTYSFGGKTWTWTGSYWRLQQSGAINNIPIGNAVPASGAFTTLSATGNITGGYLYGNAYNATGVSKNQTYVQNISPAGMIQGDVWINTDNGKQYTYFTDTNGSQWAEMEAYQSYGPGTAAATGSNTQIQFNDGGSVGASANLTFDKVTNTLNATTVTANGAPLATTGKAIAMAIVFGF